MNSQRQRNQALKNALQNKKAVKVIAGIANTDLEHVLTIVEAATQAQATAVDIASLPEIVQAVRKATNLTVFVSDTDPKALAQAAKNGADVVELGNYDALYEQGLFFNHDDVLRLAKETVALIGDKALISVTIPGHLTLETQSRMAQELENMGVDMIQTEGASRALALDPTVTTLSADEKAMITFNNTQALVRSTAIPIITASGITATNANIALANGAAGVGVGSSINKLTDLAPMIQVLKELMQNVESYENKISQSA